MSRMKFDELQRTCPDCGIENPPRWYLGRCRTCGEYYHRTGETRPKVWIEAKPASCSVTDCDRLPWGRQGICKVHYDHLRKYGEPKPIGPVAGEGRATHGMSDSDEYRIWEGMWTRCTNPKVNVYPLYGGRGIAVYEGWRDFATFFADVGTRPSKRHSIDRINNNGNYEPGNVRWATAKEQANNKRPRPYKAIPSEVVRLKQAGKSAIDIAAAYGVTQRTIHRVLAESRS